MPCLGEEARIEGGGDLALKVGSLGDPSRELAALHLLGPSGGPFPQLHGAVDFACGVRSALALSLHGALALDAARSSASSPWIFRPK